MNAYLSSTKKPFSKRSAATFVDGLEGSASTRNRYIKKNSAFFKWLATRKDEEIRNLFEGMGVKETTALMLSTSDFTHYDDLLKGHIQYVGRSLNLNGLVKQDAYCRLWLPTIKESEAKAAIELAGLYRAI